MEGYIVNRAVGKSLTEKMTKNSVVIFLSFNYEKCQTHTK